MLFPDVELRPREALLRAGSLSWWTQTRILAIGTVLLPIGGIGLLALPIAWWRMRSVALWVTSQRVVVHQGILARHRVELPVHRIDAVTVDQGLMQRLAGIGDLKLSVEGTDRVWLEGITEPAAVRAAIWRAQVGALR